MSEYSLISTDGLSKLGIKLVDRISEGIGGLCKPRHVVKMAKAEATAALIRAENELHIADLEHRAVTRRALEDVRHQQNIESITLQSVPLLNESAAPEKISDDWIANFFEKSKNISDTQMQQVWASVLAGESNSSGAFSRQTVNLLADLEANDAELFSSLCNFVWHVPNPVPLIFDISAPFYEEAGLKLSSILQLEALGLAHRLPDGFSGQIPSELHDVSYCGKDYELRFPPTFERLLPLGMVSLTSAGAQLSSICTAKPVPGLFEVVCDEWFMKNDIEVIEKTSAPTTDSQ